MGADLQTRTDKTTKGTSLDDKFTVGEGVVLYTVPTAILLILIGAGFAYKAPFGYGLLGGAALAMGLPETVRYWRNYLRQ